MSSLVSLTRPYCELFPGRSCCRHGLRLLRFQETPLGSSPSTWARDQISNAKVNSKVLDFVQFGGPFGTRTQDLRTKGPLLWSTELRARAQVRRELGGWRLESVASGTCDGGRGLFDGGTAEGWLDWRGCDFSAALAGLSAGSGPDPAGRIWGHRVAWKSQRGRMAAK